MRFAAAYAAGLWFASYVAPSPVAALLGAVVICGIGVRAGWRHRVLSAFLAGSAVGSIVQRAGMDKRIEKLLNLVRTSQVESPIYICSRTRPPF